MQFRPFLRNIADAIFGDQSFREYQALRREKPYIAEAIARDAGVSSEQLLVLAAAGRRASHLQHRMMAAFGLRTENLPAAELATLRDVEMSCSQCSSKRRCNRELHRETARANAGSFCPNARTFEFWSKAPEMRAETPS